MINLVEDMRCQQSATWTTRAAVGCSPNSGALQMKYLLLLLRKIAPNCEDGHLAIGDDYSSEARYTERERIRLDGAKIAMICR
jgi:hypothetical protein